MTQPRCRLRLQRLLSISDPGLHFAYTLRNANAEFFFYGKKVTWVQHTEWFINCSKYHPEFEFFIIWQRKLRDIRELRVGTIAVEHRKDCEFLQNLCIVDWARRQGIARWAITQLMRPGRFVVGEIQTSNKHVIKMYQDLGFWKAGA